MAIVIARGYRASFAYALESAYGVIAQNGSSNGFPYLWPGATPEATPDTNINLIKVWNIGTRNLYQMRAGAREFTVSITTNPSDINYIATSISSAVMANNTSYTLWLDYQDINQQFFYQGAKVSTMKISGKYGEVLKVETEWWSQNVNIGSSFGNTLPADPGLNLFYFGDQQVSYSSSAISTAVVLPKVWSFEFNIKNNLERVYQLGQVYIRALPEKNLELNGNIQMTFEDISQYTDAISANDFSLSINIGKDSAGTTHTLNLFNCKWDKVDFPTKPTDLVVHTLPFTCKTFTLV